MDPGFVKAAGAAGCAGAFMDFAELASCAGTAEMAGVAGARGGAEFGRAGIVAGSCRGGWATASTGVRASRIVSSLQRKS